MNWKSLAFVALFIVAVVYALQTPDAKGFMEPSMARILFFHLPCALISTWFIVMSAWFGARYLMTGGAKFDARVEACVTVGTWFSVLTMGSGIVFSRLQWNAWWHGDVRQTSFLIVLLLMAAGMALRGGLSDDKKAAKACAAYSVATVLPMLFLIFVLPRVLESLHPNTTITSGGLDSAYRIGVLLGLAVLGWAAHFFYSRICQRRELEEGTSDAPVTPIRPVPITKED